MRTSDDETLIEGHYAGDASDGTIIICSECEYEMIGSEALGDALLCGGCGVELFYRSWWSW